MKLKLISFVAIHEQNTEVLKVDLPWYNHHGWLGTKKTNSFLFSFHCLERTYGFVKERRTICGNLRFIHCVPGAWFILSILLLLMQLRLHQLCLEHQLQPFAILLRQTLDQLLEKDTDGIFAEPVSLEEVSLCIALSLSWFACMQFLHSMFYRLCQNWTDLGEEHRLTASTSTLLEQVILFVSVFTIVCLSADPLHFVILYEWL